MDMHSPLMQRTYHEVSISQAFRILVDCTIVETSGGGERESKLYACGMGRE